jgi:hypothetical protein
MTGFFSGFIDSLQMLCRFFATLILSYNDKFYKKTRGSMGRTRKGITEKSRRRGGFDVS